MYKFNVGQKVKVEGKDDVLIVRGSSTFVNSKGKVTRVKLSDLDGNNLGTINEKHLVKVD